MKFWNVPYTDPVLGVPRGANRLGRGFDGRGLDTERHGVTAPAADPTTLQVEASASLGVGYVTTHLRVFAAYRGGTVGDHFLAAQWPGRSRTILNPEIGGKWEDFA